MSNNTEKFISIYNKLETTLCELPDAPQDANIKWLETIINNVKLSNKLYTCRVLRNYIQHNADYIEFVTISDNMISFLEDMLNLCNSKLTTTEEAMVQQQKIISCSISDNIQDTINIFIIYECKTPSFSYGDISE